jgi:integrase
MGKNVVRKGWRMPRNYLHKLTATKVAGRMNVGYHADGGCLYFRVAPGGSRGWVFRFALNGRTRDMGLGAYPTITLAMAREKALEMRRLVADGIDPIERRRAILADGKAENASTLTFDAAALKYIAAHEAGWRSARHRAQWRNTLRDHVSPIIGSLPVRSIDTALVLKALEPIWQTKTETAARVRARIEVVLDWAKVRGYRTGENPARWRGHLDHLLPAKSKIKRVEHHSALPYAEIGAFLQGLRGQNGPGPLALEFLLLTATRVSEVIGATWGEVDLKTRTWTIPSERMKSGKEHRVPLSISALVALTKAQAFRSDGLIFPGIKAGRPLSQVHLLAITQRIAQGRVTLHGFRSTFRDWAAERTSYPSEVAEMALAHAVGSQVERAYQRTDLFDKRRRLMDEWAAYCATPEPAGSKVVPIRKPSK